MTDRELLAEQFEQNRDHLLAVAYRMLGSMTEADDAVQESWLRLERQAENGRDGAIENLRAWLTTVVGRVCLDVLRTRRSHKTYSPEDWRPEVIVKDVAHSNPEEEAEIADSVGLALLVVLETLSPPERLAFVLHDVFGVEFDEIGQIVGRSPVAARQLASRARRRVRAGGPVPDGNLDQQRRVVDAFLAASRTGNFEALVAVLDPAVVFRRDQNLAGERVPMTITGASAVAQQVLSRGARLVHLARPAIVNGTAGVVVGTEKQTIAVVGFTIVGGRIVALDLITDHSRMGSLIE